MSDTDRFIIKLRSLTDDGYAMLWHATYLRTLPFVPNSGWTDGDREKYRCAYMFLQRDGVNIGRASFFVIPGADAYAIVQDSFMVEGERYYDGRKAPATAGIELLDCTKHFSDDIEYAPYDGPDQRPTIVYRHNGEAVEFRKYPATVVGQNVIFKVVKATPQLVIVAAYLDGLPVIAVYYESMVPECVMETDIGPTTEVPMAPVPLTQGSERMQTVYETEEVHTDGGLVSLAVAVVGSSPTPTVTGLDGIWVLEAQSGKTGTPIDRRRLFMFTAQVPPGSGTVTIGFTVPVGNVLWSLTEWGQAAFVRNWRALQSGVVSAWTLPLPGADPTHPLFCATLVGQDVDVIPGAGWSELVEEHQTFTLQTMWRDTAADSADVSWGEAGHHLMVAFEVG